VHVSTAFLLCVIAELMIAGLALDYIRGRRCKTQHEEALTAKRVRVFTKTMPDGTDDTIQGTLVGLRAGHYVLIHAELLEAPGADGTPLDGEVWLPTENVRTIQVLQLT
jgi:hypothetical protein